MNWAKKWNFDKVLDSSIGKYLVHSVGVWFKSARIIIARNASVSWK